jgi:hypothetical protein
VVARQVELKQAGHCLNSYFRYNGAKGLFPAMYSRVPFIGSFLGDEDPQILPIIGKFLMSSDDSTKSAHLRFFMTKGVFVHQGLMQLFREYSTNVYFFIQSDLLFELFKL